MKSRYFHPMDPTLIRKAIEGHDFILGEEKKKQDDFYDRFSCRRCGHHPLTRRAHPKPFIEGEALARSLLGCESCGHVFDPHSGIDVELGNPARIPPAVPLLDPKGRGE